MKTSEHNTTISLPPFAGQVLGALEAAGAEAWVVGGYVRDALMEREAADLDIATNAHWQDVQRACEAAGMHTHETGVKHGTLTVVAPKTHEACEVTTYRNDGEYVDARHPSEVTFVNTIEEDLARRDFTINAIAYHPARGLLDPFGGLQDIEAGIIRTVGEPRKRFSEDALRILRACRFASQLGFEIEEASFKAALANKHLLTRISTERITHELDTLLMGDYVHDALMSTADILSIVVPELVAMKDFAQVTKYHIYDVLEHTAFTVQYCEKDRTLRWAAFCHDMGKPASAFFAEDGVEHFYGHAQVGAAIAAGLLERLLMSNSFRSDVVALVANHNDVIDATPRSVKRALARMDGNVELFRKLIALKKADSLAHAPEFREKAESTDAIYKVLDEILAAEDAFTLKKLAIGGDDLLAAGLKPGKKIGLLLDAALGEVIDGRLPNEKGVLLDFCLAKLKADNFGTKALGTFAPRAL